MTHLFFSKSHNRYHLSTYSQNLSFIYNKSIIFAAEIKITNKKIKKKEKNGNYSAPPMGMSNRLTVVLQQELH